jgi:hypothetical protein
VRWSYEAGRETPEAACYNSDGEELVRYRVHPVHGWQRRNRSRVGEEWIVPHAIPQAAKDCLSFARVGVAA